MVVSLRVAPPIRIGAVVKMIFFVKF